MKNLWLVLLMVISIACETSSTTSSKPGSKKPTGEDGRNPTGENPAGRSDNTSEYADIWATLIGKFELKSINGRSARLDWDSEFEDHRSGTYDYIDPKTGSKIPYISIWLSLSSSVDSEMPLFLDRGYTTISENVWTYSFEGSLKFPSAAGCGDSIKAKVEIKITYLNDSKSKLKIEATTDAGDTCPVFNESVTNIFDRVQ